MSTGSVSVEAWRQMTEAEQSALIRAGMVDFEDLPEPLRSEVEEMLQNSRPSPMAS